MHGVYDIRETYPLSKWLVLEAFDTRYQTTGITYRGENENESTTRLGGLVDLDFLPVIGLGGEIDWGVKPFDAGDQRRHRRHGQLRHDAQRARPGRRGLRVLPARHPRRARAPLRHRRPAPTTTAADKPNKCRRKEIVPLQVPDPDRTHRPGASWTTRTRSAAPSSRARSCADTYASETLVAPARLHGVRLRRRRAERPARAAGVR